MGHTFSIRLANLVVQVATLHAATYELCQSYLCDKDCPFDISVSVRQRDIDHERTQDVQGAFDDPYYETLAVYRAIAEELPRFGRMLVHGSAVAIGNRSWLFMAPSGTGKSTHARWWRTAFANENPYVINDDKPIVRVGEDGVFVYGTPWDGKERLSTNACARLAAIGLLKQGEQDFAQRADTHSATPELMRHAYRPVSANAARSTIELVLKIAEEVPLFHLRVTDSIQAAHAARAALDDVRPQGQSDNCFLQGRDRET
ncbi:MAG: hypothetical protein IJ131_06265 [Eggerthellaceae bacterium]|nr:hypothetical protein [Eggerthellaceae bacterium]